MLVPATTKWLVIDWPLLGSVVVMPFGIGDVRPALDASFDGVVYVPTAVQPTLGVETYPEFIEAGVPSIFYWVGGTSPEQVEKTSQENRPVPSNHSATFAPIPEPTSIRYCIAAPIGLPPGTTLLTAFPTTCAVPITKYRLDSRHSPISNHMHT